MKCPKCGYGHDVHTSITDPGAKPSKGDISMCLACGSILIYGEGLVLHEASEDELLAMPADIRGLLLRMTEAREEIVGNKILDRQR